MQQDIQRLISRIAKQIDAALEAAAPDAPHGVPELRDSIRHSLLAPGKRARGVLLMLAAGYGRNDAPQALAPACAIEMVHAASLIFDDLPSMDDATLRRGRAANHCAFGEATAILSGIALLTRAFSVISAEERLEAECRADLVTMLSAAIGLDGLVAGQFTDLRARMPISADMVRSVHAKKTGALFAAAAQMGGRAAGRAPENVEALRGFGLSIGVAFQTYDDLIDALSSRESASKNVGADGEKPTLVRLLGADAAEEEARTGMERAIGEIRALGPDGELLAAFAGYLAEILSAKMQQRPEGTSTASVS
jgi:geranylgeranyl diphosphate synthase type II